MKTSTVAVRRSLSIVLSATATGGAVTAALLVTPQATAAKDPCVASEVARTVGKAVYNTGDYLDSHPDANQVVTNALQQPPGAQTLGNLKSYFDANPKVQDDLAKITAPVNELTGQCKLAVNLPQVLGLLQAAQSQGALPGTGSQPGSQPGLQPGMQPIAVR